MKTPVRNPEDSTSAMCLSPHEKLKRAAAQRIKRSYLESVPTGATETKKSRRDDTCTSEVDVNLDVWISDEYLRAMDMDDRLSQDIDWVAHDDINLVQSMDALAQDHAATDDVNEFGFEPTCGGLAFEDPAEMPSTCVDPVYSCTELRRTKDAETLLMSFDTMNFALPSPTSAVSKQPTTFLLELESEQPLSSTATLTWSSTSPPPRDTVATRAATAPCGRTLDVAPIAHVTGPTKHIGSYSPRARQLRLQKFHAKRQRRTWRKKIKYDCRKKLADDRPRLKGRFVRVHETDSAASLDSMAGYASPKSPITTILSPALAPAAKTHVPRVAGIPGVQSTAGAKPASFTATSLNFVRRIASI